MYKRILITIWIIILFILILLINSANFLLHSYGDLEFATVLYQLNSSLAGTSREALLEYVVEAFMPTVLEMFILLFFCFGWNDFIKKISIQFDVRIWRYQFTYRLKQRINKGIFLSGITVIAVVMLVVKVFDVGIPKYIQDITDVSQIFEEKYVDPKDVRIDFPDKKKNLIYIYMESMETTYASVDVGGGKLKNYIPSLTKMAKDNVYFSKTDQMGGLFQTSGAGWTMAALLTSTAAVPYLMPIEDNSAGQYDTILPGLTNMGDILENAGYHNYFMCGSNAEFSGRTLYFRQHGNYEIYDYYSAIAEGVIPEDYYVFWGMEDKKLYDYAKDKLSMIASKSQPFNFTMLTVDTHYSEGYVCELCQEQYEEQYANVISCADRQITEFIDWIEEQPWYEDTVIVLVGDHLSMNESFWKDLPKGYDRGIYNCFLNTGLQVNTNNRIASALDLMPTTLAALGVEIEGNRLGLGTNLFSQTPTLAEEMGQEEFMAETSKYSEMYNQKFIKNAE